MSRPILSRPRTRVYGCNYDKGESYYKPMVDHLDRKYSGRPLFSEPRNSFADEIAARRNDIGSRGELSGPRSSGRDLDLEFDSPRPRTHAPLIDPLLNDDEETVYDIRGQRSSRRSLADDFASEVASTTRRFKAHAAGIGLDVDNYDEYKRSLRKDTDEKFSEAAKKAKSAFEEASDTFKRRSKILGEEMMDRIAEEKSALTRWSKLSGGEDESIGIGSVGGAASRAKQTKARLNDLESEMEELAERQAKRERRAAALRALVNENATASLDDQYQQQQQSSSSLSSSSKKVSIRAEKHVNF